MPVLAEDENNNFYDLKEEVEFDGDESIQDWYVILAFSIVFGVCVTLFGSVIALYSLREDALMRQYCKNAEIVKGDIMDFKFIRGVQSEGGKTGGGGGAGGAGGGGAGSAEYMLIIEYNRLLAENYTARIRKQLKVRADDFLRRAGPATSPRRERKGSYKAVQLPTVTRSGISPPFVIGGPSSQVPNGDDESLGYRKDGEVAISSLPRIKSAPVIKNSAADLENGITTGTIERQLSMVATTTKKLQQQPPQMDFEKKSRRRRTPSTIKYDQLELYVLPSHPKSGFPRRQAERNCSVGYRAPTVGLVVFNLFLTCLCARLAANALLEIEGESSSGGRAVEFVCILVLLLFEASAVHCCLDGFFLDSLREEYLDCGDFVPLLNVDESSISSGSDAHLFLTREPSVSSGFY